MNETGPSTSNTLTHLNGEFEQRTAADWETLARKSLRGDTTLEDLTKTTIDGLQLKPLYHARPATDIPSPATELKRWDNRLHVIGDSAQEQNKNALQGLQGGISSLELLVGYPELQNVLPIASLGNVLSKVQLDIAAISLHAGSATQPAADALVQLCKNKGVNKNEISISVNADPIGTLAYCGLLQTPLDEAIANVGQSAKHFSDLPNVSIACCNAVPYHNAGANASQEISAAIATACVYMDSLMDAGLNATDAANKLVFQMACDADHLLNNVKLRTLRQLWQHIAAAYGAQHATCNLVVETSQRMLSKREPWVNHLRNVNAATAAALGGAQSVIVHPHNRIDGHYIDTEAPIAIRVARNTPIILSEESAMHFVHDPMAGSYAVENLTAELSTQSWQALQTLESEGGLINSLQNGSWQQAIAAVHAERVQRLKDDTAVSVGVNRFNEATVKTDSTHANSVIPSKMQAGSVVQRLAPVREAQEFGA